MTDAPPLSSLAWRKSPASGQHDGVEVVFAESDAVLVRLSRDPDGPCFGSRAWSGMRSWLELAAEGSHRLSDCVR